MVAVATCVAAAQSAGAVEPDARGAAYGRRVERDGIWAVPYPGGTAANSAQPSGRRSRRYGGCGGSDGSGGGRRCCAEARRGLAQLVPHGYKVALSFPPSDL